MKRRNVVVAVLAAAIGLGSTLVVAPASAATELTMSCFNDLNMKDTLIPA